MASAAETVASPRRRRSGLSQRRLAALMVSPSVLIILLVAAYPIVYAIWLSLHQYSLIHKGLSRWSGFDNYSAALWGDNHQEFWSAFKTTFIFTGISVTLELVLGLAMALAMHQAFKGRGVLRATVLVPWAILTVVTAMTWKTIFDPDLGFANQMLRALHLPGGHVVWLGQSGYALAVLIFADVWKTAPFMCAYESPDGAREGGPVEIAEELHDTVEQYRTQLLDSVVETDEGLMERYLDGEELGTEEVAHALKDAVTQIGRAHV